MADICPKMAGDGDSPAKCRQARRRRIEMRRFTAISGDPPPPPQTGCPGPGEREKRRERSEGRAGDKRCRTVGPNAPSTSSPPPPPLSFSSSSSASSSSSSNGVPGDRAVPSTSSRVPAIEPPPSYGSVSLSGRSREMEDAVSIRPGFFTPGFHGASPLHFFAVYDGHGGSHVSALCKERMHLFLAEELGRASSSERGVGGGGEINREQWTTAMGRCFRRMDELALTACTCGSVGSPSCGCERAGATSDNVGSTAVVAVVGRDRVLVANCGDSRAVLSRGGRAVPLSSDHKPDRPDELARIEAAGGRVIYLNGARVLGILAMSRALGDKYLKPIVISEPEICIAERTPDDECLIIASDGLWDVLSNDLACDIARRCLQEGSQVTGGTEDLGGGEAAAVPEEEENTPESRCSLAAALLTRLALGRRSADNISVVVIDLRKG